MTFSSHNQKKLKNDKKSKLATQKSSKRGNDDCSLLKLMKYKQNIAKRCYSVKNQKASTIISNVKNKPKKIEVKGKR